ncbi:AI-2E family transporter [Gracilinema caldarium]|uniref:AI-2E family transporter n=1 Tax=Gracilinema caldarium TaxID=215591 RepID=UPI0026F13951|nr:AI-2E family transporter [Gracilinema caldarium]
MNEHFRRFNSGRANFFLVAFIALVLAGAVLKITASVVLPFIVAVLLAFVLDPIVRLLEKLKIPRVLAIILVIAGIGGGLYLAGLILFSSGKTILSRYPRYEKRFLEIYSWIAGLFGLPYDEHRTFVENLWGQLGFRNSIRDYTLSITNGFIEFLKSLVMVLLFMVFLLLESSHLEEKIALAFENRFSGKIRSIVDAIVDQVSRYLTIKFFVSLATGIFVALGLALLKVDFWLIWGIISFILNFIPTIGSLAAGAGVTLFALLQFWPHGWPVVGAFAVMLLVNFVIGNILEPQIQGENLGLSPFVVLVSLLAWGWLWGFTGLVIAVPMTVIIKIICEHVPILEPVAVLIGSYKDMQKYKKNKELLLSDQNSQSNEER